jgi:hypothetical protein
MCTSRSPSRSMTGARPSASTGPTATATPRRASRLWGDRPAARLGPLGQDQYASTPESVAFPGRRGDGAARQLTKKEEDVMLTLGGPDK